MRFSPVQEISTGRTVKMSNVIIAGSFYPYNHCAEKRYSLREHRAGYRKKETSGEVRAFHSSFPDKLACGARGYFTSYLFFCTSQKENARQAGRFRKYGLKFY